MFINMMIINEILMIVYFFFSFILNTKREFHDKLLDGIYIICICAKVIETIVNIKEMKKF